MKRIFFLTYTAVVISMQAICQDIINYDFLTKHFTINSNEIENSKLILKYNKTYRFSITNIDKRLYGDFSLSSEQKDFFESELQPSFDKIITVPNENKDTSVTKKNDSLTIDIVSQLTKINLEIDDLIKNLRLDQKVNLISLLSDKNKNSQKEKDLKSKFPNIDFEKLSKKMEQKEEETKKEELIIYFKDSYSKLNSIADMVISSFESIEKLKVLNNDIVDLYKTYNISYQENKFRIIELEKKYQSVLEKKEMLMIEFDGNYQNFKNSYNSFMNDKKIKDFLKLHEDYLQSIKNMAKSIDEKKSNIILFNKNNGFNKMIENIQIMMFKLKNETITDLYFADQIVPKKDQIQINIQYKEALTKKPEDYVIPKDFSYTFEVKGGMKITMSTGLMLTMGLYDRKYSIYPMSDSSYSEIKQDANNSLFQPTIGAMMHVIYRSSSSFTGGFTWGIGTDVSTISNMTIFMGGSFVIGREERFILSAGFATAPVDYLKGKYSTNILVENSNIDLNGITEKVFRPGLFFGFTYNLINQKKEKLGSVVNN